MKPGEFSERCNRASVDLEPVVEEADMSDAAVSD